VNGTFAKMLIVVPDEEVTAFRNVFKSTGSEAHTSYFQPHNHQCSYCCQNKKSLPLPFPVEVVADGILLSIPAAMKEKLHQHARGAGYRLQMLLKLAVALLVETPFYLTLDLDVFMTRPTTREGFFVDGRALIQGEGWAGGKTQHRAQWWAAAEQVLKTGPTCCYTQDLATCGNACDPLRLQPRPSIGVTPALLSVRISMALQAEIESLYATMAPLRWDAILISLLRENDWTEYTLYWTFACKSKFAESDHSDHFDLKLYTYVGFSHGSATVSLSTSAAIRGHYFGNNRAIFGVIQSINGLSALTIVEKIRPFLVVTEAADDRDPGR